MALSVVNPSSSWVVNDIGSLSLVQKIGLNPDQIPSQKKEELGLLFSEVLNTPYISQMFGAQKGTVNFDFDIDERRGFLLRVGTEPAGRPIAPFSELINPKSITPSSRIYRLLKDLEGLVLLENLGKKLGLPPSERAELLNTLSNLVEMGKRRDSEKIEALESAMESLATFMDTNSAIRNLIVASQFSPAVSGSAAAAALGTAVTISQFFTGILALVSGALVFSKGAANALKAGSCKDWEGVIKHSLIAGVGGGLTTVGVGFGAQGLALLMNSLHPILATASTVTPAGIIVMGVFQLVDALYGLAITKKFAEEFDIVLDVRKEPNELKRLKNGLAWVQKQIDLSEFDVAEIRKTAPNPKKANEIIKNKLQKKRDQFERRTNGSCSKFVYENLGAVRKGLNSQNKNIQESALVAARGLVQKIDEANYKQQINCMISYGIALLSIAAGICALIWLSPILTIPVLFIIIALLWLTLDNSRVNRAVLDCFWKNRQASLFREQQRRKVLNDVEAWIANSQRPPVRKPSFQGHGAHQNSLTSLPISAD